MSEARVFRCGAAARWLPRTLGAAALVGAMLLSTRIYSGVAGSGWLHSKTLVVVAGAFFALLVVRAGGSVRWLFELLPAALAIRVGKHRRELPYDQITSIAYETPFVSRREWLPAMILTDRFGKRWRVPALIEDGAEFVETLIRVSGREDLEMHVDAHGLRQRMQRVRGRLGWGYVVAVAIVLVCLWISRTGPGV